jgi:enoyl-CoA hydratase/carnithine racemase
VAVEVQQSGEELLIVLGDEGKFNPGSLGQVNAALDQLLATPAIKRLVITGEDRIFAQGLDLAYLGSVDGEQAFNFVHDCMAMIGRLLTAPVPVVSAVNGHAFGLGAMIMLASDFRVMRNDRGFFCLPEVDLNMVLIPSMNALVCGKLSPSLVRDALLGGARIGGEQALQRGLVDVCCEQSALLSEARNLAAAMEAKDRATLTGLKQGINREILRAIAERRSEYPAIEH